MPPAPLACRFADDPEQTDTFAAVGAWGTGFTVTVTKVGLLSHPFAVDVT